MVKAKLRKVLMRIIYGRMMCFYQGGEGKDGIKEIKNIENWI
ncbi:hypothetical protein [Clostridium estertheticum]|nr:hypothetical protein [Clostridium estertheticum]